MSKTKSNVNPGNYKVAGRERQGEDVVHDRERARLAENRASLDPADLPQPAQPHATKSPAAEEVRDRARRPRRLQK